MAVSKNKEIIFANFACPPTGAVFSLRLCG
jgi:hypothetical protein